VAIIEGLNHSLKQVTRDYKEITLFQQWKDKLEKQESTKDLPAGKYHSLLLPFYDSYYYIKECISLL